MIDMKCPHCGHQLRIRSKFAGKQGQCKHCQNFVDVPNTYVALANEPAAAEPVGDIGTLSTKLAKPTALADLMADSAPQPAGHLLPPAADAVETVIEPTAAGPYQPIGFLYWVLFIFFTPAALIWGIVLPSGHPQKKLAIVAPIVFVVVSIAIVVVAFVALPIFLLSTFDEDSGGIASGVSNDGRLSVTPSIVDMEVSPYETVTLQTNSPSGMQGDLTWRSSDASIAKVVGGPRSAMIYGMGVGTATVTAENIMSGEQATATVNVSPASTSTAVLPGQAYADLGLPRYPTLSFDKGDLADNELSGPLADADPSTLTTYKGYVTLGYEEITAFYYEELGNRGWVISDYGYGDEANSETYIIASNDGFGIVYHTSKAASRTRVVITHGPLN